MKDGAGEDEEGCRKSGTNSGNNPQLVHVQLIRGSSRATGSKGRDVWDEGHHNGAQLCTKYMDLHTGTGLQHSFAVSTSSLM